MCETLLALQDICKQFSGINALQHVHFDVRAGEVHVLMGENGAGKSTLMKIISGIYRADSGAMEYLGKPTTVLSPGAAQAMGIAMIHQELNNVPDMTIAENLFLGREPTRHLFLDRRKMNADASELLQKIRMNFDPNRKMNTLSIAQMQMVEIVKAISLHARILIMDEPTSAISNQEVETLFEIIRMLRNQQVGIIYISHKMEETFRIADRITVLRDGQSVGTYPKEELNRDRLIMLMVGRELTHVYPPRTQRQPGKALLTVNGLCNDAVHNVHFTLHSGEVLGIGGLMGAGRSELLESLFGVRSCCKGNIEINGQITRIRSPRDAIAHSMAFVTEDRKRTGLNLKTTIKRDMSIVTLAKFCRMRSFVRDHMENQAVDQGIRDLNIKTPSRNQMVVNLSGGNQQKVILARWLMACPEIILLDEPTRGIDVGAKYEIYKIIQNLAAQGKGVLMVSSELPELIGVCDRVLMVCHGEVTGELLQGDMTQEAMMQLATKERTKP